VGVRPGKLVLVLRRHRRHLVEIKISDAREVIIEERLERLVDVLALPPVVAQHEEVFRARECHVEDAGDVEFEPLGPKRK
jgi:hypothetical protein